MTILNNLIDNFDNLDGVLRTKALEQAQEQIKAYQKDIDNLNDSVKQSQRISRILARYSN